MFIIGFLLSRFLTAYIVSQPLIPLNLDPIGGIASVQFTITTFYAPTYMLSTLMQERMDDLFTTKRFGKKVLTTATFVGISHELLSLHSEFGMVLPIPYSMEKTMPSLFRLLVPDELEEGEDGKWASFDKELYSELEWLKRNPTSTADKQGTTMDYHQKGWSNFPLMVWIVAFLIHKEHIGLKDMSEKFPKKGPSRSLEDYVPYIVYDEEDIVLSDFIKLLLFVSETEEDNEREVLMFQSMIEEKLKNVTKAAVYEGLAHAFDPLLDKCFPRDDVAVDYPELVQELSNEDRTTWEAYKSDAERNQLDERLASTVDMWLRNNKGDTQEESQNAGTLLGQQEAQQPEPEVLQGESLQSTSSSNNNDEKDRFAQKVETRSKQDELSSDSSDDDVDMNQAAGGDKDEVTSPTSGTNLQMKIVETSDVDMETSASNDFKDQERQKESRFDSTIATNGNNTSRLAEPELKENGVQTREVDADIDRNDASKSQEVRFSSRIAELQQQTSNPTEKGLISANATTNDKKRSGDLYGNSPKRRKVKKGNGKSTGEKEGPQSLVPTVHANLPPVGISATSASWYWESSSVQKKKGIWSSEATFDDVCIRIRLNLSKLFFTTHALEYAKHCELTNGYDLFSVLAEPTICDDKDDRNSWKNMLETVQEIIIRLDNEGGVEVPFFPFHHFRKTSDFRKYFSYVLDTFASKQPSKISSSTDPMSCCWKRVDVMNFREFDVGSVLATVHHWKCSILYDSICRSYFNDNNIRQLQDALFGYTGRASVFPKQYLKSKYEWEYDFNLLVSNTPDFFFSPSNKKTTEHEESFLDYLLTYNRTRWNQLYVVPKSSTLTNSDEPPVAGDAESNQTDTKARPSIIEAKLDDKQALLDELQQLFFLPGGYLRHDLRKSIKFTHPHGFIGFGEHVTDDVRYYIVFERVSPAEQGKVHVLYDLITRYFCANFGFDGFMHR